jgi:thiamine-phosphate pyrophosphorylase
MRLPQIWLITMPEARRGPVDPIAEALEGCNGERVGIQLRAKDARDRELVAWGRELRAITRCAGCLLVVNRRPDVAQIVEADGVHLPETGLPVEVIREHWPGFTLIGTSRHSRPGLLAARAQGADFAFLSPVFRVPGKAPPIGVDGLQRAIEDVGIPTYALGGVGHAETTRLLAAGAIGIAVRRAVCDAKHPREALQRFLRELDKSVAGSE